MSRSCAQTVSSTVSSHVQTNRSYTQVEALAIKPAWYSPFSPPLTSSCAPILRRLFTTLETIFYLLKSRLYTLSTPPTITSTTYINNNRKKGISQ